MIICLCHRVSDRDIAREAKAGCASFEALMERTRVGTGCGACLHHAREAFDGQSRAECGDCPDATRCGATTLTLAA